MQLNTIENVENWKQIYNFQTVNDNNNIIQERQDLLQKEFLQLEKENKRLRNNDTIGCSSCKCSCYKRHIKLRKLNKEIVKSIQPIIDYYCMYCDEKFNEYNIRNAHCLEKHADDTLLLIAVLPGENFDHPGKKLLIKDCFKLFSSAVDREKIQRQLKKIPKIGLYNRKDYSLLPFKLPRNASGVELIEYTQEIVQLLLEIICNVNPTRQVNFVEFNYDENTNTFYSF